MFFKEKHETGSVNNYTKCPAGSLDHESDLETNFHFPESSFTSSERKSIQGSTIGKQLHPAKSIPFLFNFSFSLFKNE